MTRIAIKPKQLDQLASGIQDAERKADEAITDFKWNYQSLLINITGANTGKIDALQAELQYEMRKYRDKLHDLQAAVKLTERKLTEEDRSLSAKFGLLRHDSPQQKKAMFTHLSANTALFYVKKHCRSTDLMVNL